MLLLPLQVELFREKVAFNGIVFPLESFPMEKCPLSASGLLETVLCVFHEFIRVAFASQIAH